MLPLAILTVALGGVPPADNPAGSPADLAAWIDAKSDAAAKAGQAPAHEPAGDELFLRRAYLDLNGTIPSVAEARDFLATRSPGKRHDLVRDLLAGKRYGEHFAALWARTLAPAGNSRGALEAWLAGELRANRPFDQVARTMLTATGDRNAGPAGFVAAVGNQPERLAESVARGLLGVRLGCAQCHDHPTAAWTRDDFWGLAAFFAGPAATSITPADGTKEYAAKFLGGPAPAFPKGVPPRAVLADWVATKENPFFAANVVNRVWQDLCGTPLVGPVDDLDTVPAEERAVLLDGLANKFAESGFNLRWLVEGICLSRAYQQASSPGAAHGPSGRPVRSLSPDQVFAALDQALALKKGRGLSPRSTPEGMTLRTKLEEARGTTPTDFKAGIPQALLLMNGALVAQATTLEDSLTLRAVIDAPFLGEAEKLDALFLAAYSRLPRAEERDKFMAVVAASPGPAERRQAYANIFWALLNSPEFLLCP